MNLNVRMGLQQILRGVSLQVDEAQVVAVLGSNGVGKTTLMRAVSGIYKSQSGSIRLLGEEIIGLSSSAVVKRRLCQAPEGRQIFANMTVLENLKMGAYHQPKAHFDEDLDRVMAMFPVLKERTTQKAGSLSGGEQQMLCIGRALMGRPRLLLLDEPSLGLAPLMVKCIFDMIAAINETGASILLVEQNVRAALAVAEYAYIMEGGRMVMEGPAAELRDDERIRDAYLGGHVHQD
jgi:branched-chain amino acid transport system ATP-binding protein